VIFGDSCNHFQAWRGWREELKPIVAAIDYEIDAIGGWPEKKMQEIFYGIRPESLVYFHQCLSEREDGISLRQYCFYTDGRRLMMGDGERQKK
jgi:hypothetical protein